MKHLRITGRMALSMAMLVTGLVACGAPGGEPFASNAAPLEGAARSDDGAALGGVPQPLVVTRILLTNDDGIAAPGIQALYTALSAIPNTEVKVVAPALNQSGTGSGITTGGAMTLNLNAPLQNGVDTGVALGARPADTVRFALQRVYTGGTKPDLIISGFNSGQNPGLSFGSGTVGAAQTGSMNGIPSIACSLGITFVPPAVFGSTVAEYAEASGIMRRLVERIIQRDPDVRPLTQSLDKKDLLNINFPPRNIQGILVTRPGNFDVVINYVDLPDGRVAPQLDLSSLETFSPTALAQGLETDVGALAAGYVTIAPWRHADLGPDRVGSCCSTLLTP